MATEQELKISSPLHKEFQNLIRSRFQRQKIKRERDHQSNSHRNNEKLCCCGL